jgi:hypothetical protein
MYRCLHFPHEEKALDGIFPRYLFWHGLVTPWPALRVCTTRGDMTSRFTEASGTVSKVRLVCETIDKAVGIQVYRGSVYVQGVEKIGRPTVQRLFDAHRFVLSVEGDPTTATFTRFYRLLRNVKA